VYETSGNVFFAPNGEMADLCSFENFDEWQSAGQDAKSIVNELGNMEAIVEAMNNRIASWDN